MKKLKSKGKRELKSFFNRLNRSYGMGRIKKEDYGFLHDRIEEVLNRVEEMKEYDEGEDEWTT